MEENKATVEHPTGNGNAERWVSLSGKRVRLHVPVANYEGSQAEIDLAEAERVLARLEELLQPPPERREQTVDLYMSGAWGTSIPLRLTRELVVRWFGPHADVSPFVEGIAGFVAVPEGASGIDDAHDWVAAELEQRRAVSILPRPTPAGVVGGIGTVDERAATSFLAYLIETYGAPALRQLLETYDPNRRDQAVQAAFRQPLGALEEAWIAWIERRSEAGVSFVRFILPLLKPYWKRELEVLVYMGIGLSYSLVLPLASRHLVDTIIPEGDKQALLIFILAIFTYYILDASVGMRRLYVTTIINRRILMEFQERLFAHLLRLPQSFYARMKIGDLLSRINNDLEVVQIAMMQVTGVMPFLIMRAVAAAIAVVLLEPLLGAIVLIVVPIFAVSYLMVAKRLGKAGMERQQRIGEVEAALQENLSAHSVIVAFGLEGRMIAALRARLEAVFKVFLRVVVLAGLFETSAVLATTLGQILVLGVGGYLAMEGEITIGTFLAYVGLLPSLFQPIAALATVSQTVQTASGALDRVNELLDEPVTVTDAPNAVAAVPLQREIRLESVTFAYDTDRPVLRDLDLVIPAGTHVAIVGPSGSGKSTVVNLLLRFWDPTEGRVLRDGQDQRDATLASLRGEIGLVFQDTFVFDMTIRENIAIGRLGATDAEVVTAAEAARLHDYVATLPAGYDTVVGERGVRMSGGQRQRLAIARALLRDPGVLILDEATSALDSRTEAEIWETITQVSQGRTTVNITHRLSVAASADRIAVLDQGRLVEEGTHTELVEAGGLYQRLYDEQTGRVTSTRARLSVASAASLRVIPLFSGLKDEALAALAERVQVEHFPAGLEVVRQGEEGDKLYFVNGGRLVVVIADPQGERQVNTLKTGDYFGEMAVLTGEPRTATVRSLAPTELYSLSKADFMALLTREPRIAEAVSRVVAERRDELKVIASATHDSQDN